MPNEKNIQNVKELREKVANAKSMVFAEYHGLGANLMNELRATVRETGAEISIAKNTLLKLALKEENVDDPKTEEQLKGPMATIFSYEDAIAPIKALTDFIEKHELPTIKSGIIDGKFATASEINILSKLPSKEELLARVVGGLKSPITGFVNVLGGPQRGLVTVLKAISEKKE